jgi:dipeptidyl aminopeptidase/acylaminoacyl peptidase
MKKIWAVLAMVPLLSRSQETARDSATRANRMRIDSLHRYLYSLSDKELYTKSNLELIGSAMEKSTESEFNLFYRHERRVDALVQQQQYAERVVDQIIYREEIKPILWKNSQPIAETPDWVSLHKKILMKYGSVYADRILLNAKIRFYTAKNDWPEIIRFRLLKLDREGVDSSVMGCMATNNIMWFIIFMHSNDKATLKKALRWEKIVVELYPKDPEYLDTYANLLYKLGRKEEALIWEEKALMLAPSKSEFEANFEKMKKREPTWETMVQRQEIDSTAIADWPNLDNARISDNGNYASYVVENSLPHGSCLTIQSIKTGWKKEYVGGNDCRFAQYNQKAYILTKDTLYILTLSRETSDRAIAINYPRNLLPSNGDWLSYELKNTTGKLVVLNFSNGEEMRFDSVKDYLWENDGKALLLSIQDSGRTIFEWVDVPSRTAKQIWSTKDSLSNPFLRGIANFNNLGNQLIFTTTIRKSEHTLSNVWYYSPGMAQANKLVDSQDQGIPAGFCFLGPPVFSQNGRWIFLRFQKQPIQNINHIADAAMVDIYSYKDYELQSQQLEDLRTTTIYTAVVPISGGPVIQLEHEGAAESRIFTKFDQVVGDYVVLGEKLSSDFKPWWLSSPFSWTYFLVSLKDGARTLLKNASRYPIGSFSFSPDGSWLVYWDSKLSGYASYYIPTGKTRFATQNIAGLTAEIDYIDMYQNSMYPQGIGQIIWLKTSKSFLAYDNYDIWKIDPTARRKIVNITNGYGLKHHIAFRLVYEKAYNGDEQVLLSAFNKNNKQNGFYQVSLALAKDPQLLTMGPYCYYRTNTQLPSHRYSFSHELLPLQAKEAQAWVISRESANEYPNYFYTQDWKHFIPLTHLQPQISYNWMASELVTYKQLDGAMSQGVLYKPEDFDPGKKYPVIFNYYEHLSYRLHEFPFPEYIRYNINIPWFVSRGYLVFTPDIHFSVASRKGGKTVGEAAYNSIEAAATYLSKLAFVDSKRLGLQGHSFGGGETNYLVTHSHLFAAACSAGGTVSDEISAYLGPYRPKGGFPKSYRLAHAENGHDMIGATLWERPDLYFRSSSIFNANDVTTPLLLMHNEKDDQTDWGQSFELFTALRRLGKPVWLLQYDEEGHVLGKMVDQKDFTTRLTQFFDHYLKGAPAPVWMTRGIPARLKAIDQGYELDLSGKQP